MDKSTTKVTQSQVSVKWDDMLHLNFIELCEEEIRKGNRPNCHLSSVGWNNLIKAFNERTAIDARETGLGWDDVRKTIIADDEWWNDKIKVNKEYKKFKNKDLSLIWYRYDALFSDITATGDRAWAPSQIDDLNIENEFAGESLGMSENRDEEIDVDFERDDDNDVVGRNIEEFEHVPFKFPSSSLNKRKIGGTNNNMKKGKSSVASSLKENIDSLIAMLSDKTTAESSSSLQHEPTITECMDMLKKMPGIEVSIPLCFYASNLFTKKDMREVFFCHDDNEVRLNWLKYNYMKSEGKSP
ncbi:hypothetical protein Pint_18795 [Pistacia integerrima]|uniref:Uncharacterized protein n=1 Tax=Pistacia integerrima TaxID=434235 RepID=A0ACC0YYM8_9ROSI|nr:hypothetical protein Pint_18795 [Pistacia integerrima]